MARMDESQYVKATPDKKGKESADSKLAAKGDDAGTPHKAVLGIQGRLKDRFLEGVKRASKISDDELTRAARQPYLRDTDIIGMADDTLADDTWTLLVSPYGTESRPTVLVKNIGTDKFLGSFVKMQLGEKDGTVDVFFEDRERKAWACRSFQAGSFESGASIIRPEDSFSIIDMGFFPKDYRMGVPLTVGTLIQGSILLRASMERQMRKHPKSVYICRTWVAQQRSGAEENSELRAEHVLKPSEKDFYLKRKKRSNNDHAADAMKVDAKKKKKRKRSIGEQPAVPSAATSKPVDEQTREDKKSLKTSLSTLGQNTESGQQRLRAQQEISPGHSQPEKSTEESQLVKSSQPSQADKSSGQSQADESPGDVPPGLDRGSGLGVKRKETKQGNSKRSKTDESSDTDVSGPMMIDEIDDLYEPPILKIDRERKINRNLKPMKYEELITKFVLPMTETILIPIDHLVPPSPSLGCRGVTHSHVSYLMQMMKLFSSQEPLAAEVVPIDRALALSPRRIIKILDFRGMDAAAIVAKIPTTFFMTLSGQHSTLAMKTTIEDSQLETATPVEIFLAEKFAFRRCRIIKGRMHQSDYLRLSTQGNPDAGLRMFDTPFLERALQLRVLHGTHGTPERPGTGKSKERFKRYMTFEKNCAVILKKEGRKKPLSDYGWIIWSSEDTYELWNQLCNDFLKGRLPGRMGEEEMKAPRSITANLFRSFEGNIEDWKIREILKLVEEQKLLLVRSSNATDPRIDAHTAGRLWKEQKFCQCGFVEKIKAMYPVEAKEKGINDWEDLTRLSPAFQMQFDNLKAALLPAVYKRTTSTPTAKIVGDACALLLKRIWLAAINAKEEVSRGDGPYDTFQIDFVDGVAIIRPEPPVSHPACRLIIVDLSRRQPQPWTKHNVESFCETVMAKFASEFFQILFFLSTNYAATMTAVLDFVNVSDERRAYSMKVLFGSFIPWWNDDHDSTHSPVLIVRAIISKDPKCPVSEENISSEPLHIREKGPRPYKGQDTFNFKEEVEEARRRVECEGGIETEHQICAAIILSEAPHPSMVGKPQIEGIGGYAPRWVQAEDLIRKFSAEGELVLDVCSGGWVSKAALTSNRRVAALSAFPEEQDFLLSYFTLLEQYPRCSQAFSSFSNLGETTEQGEEVFDVSVSLKHYRKNLEQAASEVIEKSQTDKEYSYYSSSDGEDSDSQDEEVFDEEKEGSDSDQEKSSDLDTNEETSVSNHHGRKVSRIAGAASKGSGAGNNCDSVEVKHLEVGCPTFSASSARIESIGECVPVKRTGDATIADHDEIAIPHAHPLQPSAMAQGIIEQYPVSNAPGSNASFLVVLPDPSGPVVQGNLISGAEAFHQPPPPATASLTNNDLDDGNFIRDLESREEDSRLDEHGKERGDMTRAHSSGKVDPLSLENDLRPEKNSAGNQNMSLILYRGGASPILDHSLSRPKQTTRLVEDSAANEKMSLIPFTEGKSVITEPVLLHSEQSIQPVVPIIEEPYHVQPDDVKPDDVQPDDVQPEQSFDPMTQAVMSPALMSSFGDDAERAQPAGRGGRAEGRTKLVLKFRKGKASSAHGSGRGSRSREESSDVPAQSDSLGRDCRFQHVMMEEPMKSTLGSASSPGDKSTNPILSDDVIVSTPPTKSASAVRDGQDPVLSGLQETSLEFDKYGVRSTGISYVSRISLDREKVHPNNIYNLFLRDTGALPYLDRIIDTIPTERQQKLLVLSLDTFLSIHTRSPDENPDFQISQVIEDSGRQIQFRFRPDLLHFLQALSKHFILAIWSFNIPVHAQRAICSRYFSISPLFCWNLEQSQKTCVRRRGELVHVKSLSVLLKSFPDMDSSRVLFIDDEPLHLVRNPPHTYVCLPCYTDQRMGRFLSEILLPYLMLLKDSWDVRSFVENHHPRWSTDCIRASQITTVYKNMVKHMMLPNKSECSIPEHPLTVLSPFEISLRQRSLIMGFGDHDETYSGRSQLSYAASFANSCAFQKALFCSSLPYDEDNRDSVAGAMKHIFEYLFLRQTLLPLHLRDTNEFSLHCNRDQVVDLDGIRGTCSVDKCRDCKWRRPLHFYVRPFSAP